jgi:hypothetical protein
MDVKLLRARCDHGLTVLGKLVGRARHGWMEEFCASSIETGLKQFLSLSRKAILPNVFWSAKMP